MNHCGIFVVVLWFCILQWITCVQSQIVPRERRVVVRFENMVYGPASYLEGFQTPWMFDEGDDPFTESMSDIGRYAFRTMSMSPGNVGDSSCESGGISRTTTTFIRAVDINLESPPSSFDGYSASITDLNLDDFEKINTVNEGEPWDTLGEAGDTRFYSGPATFEIRDNSGNVVLRAVNINYTQTLTYPSPAGAAAPGTFITAAYFLGMYDLDATDREWREQLDPDQNGVFFGALSAPSLGGNRCYSANSFDINVVPILGGGGLPNPPSSQPDPSTPSEIETGKRIAESSVILAGLAGFTSLGFSIASLVLLTMLAAVGTPPSAYQSASPGQGVVKLLQTAQYCAIVGQIRGAEYSEQYQEFNRGLDPFLMRFDSPFADTANLKTSQRAAATSLHQSLIRTLANTDGNQVSESVSARILSLWTSRQDTDFGNDSFVDEDAVKAVAFYSFLALGLCAALHIGVWLALRKAHIRTQLAVHAMFAYITMIVIAWVYAGSLLASIQFLAAYSDGSASTGAYVAASFMLIFIGVGVLAVVSGIGIIAFLRHRRGVLEWVPKAESTDAKVRNSKLFAGEYLVLSEQGAVEDADLFHSVFACWYEGFRGPRLYMFFAEWLLLVLMSLVVASIGSSSAVVIIAGIITAVFAVSILLLAPFVDLIEQIFIAAVALLELIIAMLTLGAVYAEGGTINDLNEASMILQLIAIVLTIVLAVYLDVVAVIKYSIELIQRYRNRHNAEELDELEAAKHMEDMALQKSLDDVDVALSQGLFDDPENPTPYTARVKSKLNEATDGSLENDQQLQSSQKLTSDQSSPGKSPNRTMQSPGKSFVSPRAPQNGMSPSAHKSTGGSLTSPRLDEEEEEQRQWREFFNEDEI